MLILKFARKTSITIFTEFKQPFTKNIKYWPSWNFGQDHHLELFQVSVREAIISEVFAWFLSQSVHYW